MNSLTKNKWLGVLSAISVFLFSSQVLIPTMPVTPTTAETIGGVILLLLSLTTVWKQWLSNNISNTAINATLFVAVAASIVGVIDFLQFITLPELTVKWIQFGFALILMVLNVISTWLFPSEALKEEAAKFYLYVKRD